jgi:hypothetical protein
VGAHPLVYPGGLVAAACCVQGADEQCGQPFPLWVRRGQLGEQVHHRTRRAAVHLQLSEVLRGGQPLLGHPHPDRVQPAAGQPTPTPRRSGMLTRGRGGG